MLKWREVFNDQQLFEPLAHTTVCYTHASTEEDVVNRMLASKIIGAFSADEITKLRSDIRTVLNRHSLDQQALAIPYRVELYWTERTLDLFRN
jgi:hypothetical protein